MLFWPIFGNFWFLVVTLAAFSSNLSNFERNPQKTEKIIIKFKKFQNTGKILTFAFSFVSNAFNLFDCIQFFCTVFNDFWLIF